MRSIHQRTFVVVAAALVIGACLFTAPQTAHAQWRWQLPPERYQKMNAFERGQYDKAAKLFEQSDFLAAASEFEKFEAQYGDSPNLSYMIFMHGFSLHQAKSRNTAIKVYNKVMDFFAEKVEDAAPSLYFIGVAEAENGRQLEAMKAWKEMVEDKDYQKHPLAAGALRQLADNHWANKEYDDALKYWRQVIRDFEKANPEETKNARQNLISYYIKAPDYAGYEQALIKENEKHDDPAFARNIHELLYQVAWYGFAQPDWGKYVDKDPKKAAEMRAADMQAWYTYFRTTKPAWDAANDSWDYYEHCSSFLTYRWGDPDQRNIMADESVAYVKTVAATNKAQADQEFSRLCDFMRDQKQQDRGRAISPLISDRLMGAYKDYEFQVSEQKWDAAIGQLKDIESRGDATWTLKAQNERARLYKDALGKFDEAIALYQLINQPPTTLWYIHECFVRSNRLDQGLATLTEIENSFPDWASRAAWQKTQLLDNAGQKDRAIASARRVLQNYPKSGESSSAHQMLEKYGINTGGGLTDEP